jgi:hypothetical protein
MLMALEVFRCCLVRGLTMVPMTTLHKNLTSLAVFCLLLWAAATKEHENLDINRCFWAAGRLQEPFDRR